MGWGSATVMFDAAVDVALSFIPTYDAKVRQVVEKMYTKVNWDDWDTQDESKYFNDHLIHIMHKRGEIDSNEYAWHCAGQPKDWDWENRPF